MPDFSAISSLLGAVKNVLEGIVGFAGSVSGNDVAGMLEGLGSAAAEEATGQ